MHAAKRALVHEWIQQGALLVCRVERLPLGSCVVQTGRHLVEVLYRNPAQAAGCSPCLACLAVQPVVPASETCAGSLPVLQKALRLKPDCIAVPEE